MLQECPPMGFRRVIHCKIAAVDLNVPHPFLEAGRYPWTLPEARELHKQLYQLVKLANDIEAIYQECSMDLEPLERQAPSPMWRAALDAIAAAHLLTVLGERLEARKAQPAL